MQRSRWKTFFVSYTNSQSHCCIDKQLQNSLNLCYSIWLSGTLLHRQAGKELPECQPHFHADCVQGNNDWTVLLLMYCSLQLFWDTSHNELNVGIVKETVTGQQLRCVLFISTILGYISLGIPHNVNSVLAFWRKLQQGGILVCVLFITTVLWYITEWTQCWLC